jgi:hypothetical protein
MHSYCKDEDVPCLPNLEPSPEGCSDTSPPSSPAIQGPDAGNALHSTNAQLGAGCQLLAHGTCIACIAAKFHTLAGKFHISIESYSNVAIYVCVCLLWPMLPSSIAVLTLQ